jgi:hypothetical protein
MRSYTLKKLIPWLLPLLVARLCVPAGFMVASTSNGLDVTLCPDYAALPGQATPQSTHVQHQGSDHTGHAMHGDVASEHSHHGSPHEGHSTSVCPFAASGSGTVSPTVATVTPVYTLVDRITPARDRSAWRSPAVLVNRIRGPPGA